MPSTKINLKWIEEHGFNGFNGLKWNVRPEAIKLLKKNIGRTLDDINQSKIPYDPPPRVTEIKTQVKKCT